jgi:hypothetical protein
MMGIRTFAILAIAFGESVALAGTVTMPSVAPHSLYFYSSAPKSITFYLTTDNKSWSEFNVDSGAAQTIDVEGSPTSLAVAIKTGEKVCQVGVDGGHRYEIYWNAADQEYCVRPLTPR